MDSYLDGRPSDAYKEIESIFINNEENNLLIDTFDKISYPGEYKQLYRARTGDFYSYDKNQMFHIPFNKREFIPTERYSIPGSPCLYLGGSVYVCWEELGRPDFNKLYVSRFEANPLLRILDLSYTVQDITLANNGRSKDFKKRFIMTWPIICACSIKVKNRLERKFKTEYVIPQLILQVARNRETKIDGIAYFSVNGDYSKQLCKPVFINYVFPAINKDNGAPLKDNFKLTSPLNYGLCKQISQGSLDGVLRYLKLNNTLDLNDNVYRNISGIDIFKGYGPTYNLTDFFSFEKLLGKIKVEKLD